MNEYYYGKGGALMRKNPKIRMKKKQRRKLNAERKAAMKRNNHANS